MADPNENIPATVPEQPESKPPLRKSMPIVIALVVIVVLIGIANISSLLNGNKRTAPQSSLTMSPTTPNAQQVSTFETQQQQQARHDAEERQRQQELADAMQQLQQDQGVPGPEANGTPPMTRAQRAAIYGESPNAPQHTSNVSEAQAEAKQKRLAVEKQQLDARNSDTVAIDFSHEGVSDDFRLGFANTKSNADTTAPIWQSVSGNPYHTLGDTLGLLNISDSTSAEAFVRIPGVGGASVNTDTTSGALTQWNVRNTFSLQVASHLLRLGLDERYVTSAVNPATISVQADFFDHQSMVDGVASDVAITRSEPARPVLNQFSAFAQDEWRVSKALTLSLGLRWEVNPPPTGKQGLDAYTAIGDVTSPSALRVAPRGTPLWHTGWSNFAPRFGSAWMIDDHRDWETILRIGAGVFFDTGNRPALQAFRAAGFTQTRFLRNAPLPVTSAQLEFPSATTAPFSNSTLFVFPSHLQLPYSIQWDVALEKALGRNEAFTISYVGSHGSRLLQEQRRNISQVNSDLGNVSFFPNGITSNYQSLQMKFQRTIAHGLQGLASYTWAHSLDYGSTDPAYSLNYGNSDYDVRHNLEGALSWDLPGPRNTWLKYLLGSWGLDGRLIARTAFPVTLNGNLFSDPVTGHRYYNSVDLIPNRPLYLYGASYPGGKIIIGGPSATDPAFALPDGTDAGNAPRNFIRGFNAVQANLGIRREMPIYDRVKVELRTDTFNVLNHPNFGYIDPALTDTLFGQSTRMLNQSFGPNGSIYQQGGPRSVQFSFKMIF